MSIPGNPISGIHEDDLGTIHTSGSPSGTRMGRGFTPSAGRREEEAAKPLVRPRLGNVLTGMSLRRSGWSQVLMTRFTEIVNNNQAALSGTGFQISAMPSVGGCGIDGGITIVAHSDAVDVALAMSILTLGSLPAAKRASLTVTDTPCPLSQAKSWAWPATPHHYYAATTRNSVAAEVATHVAALGGARLSIEQVVVLNPMAIGEHVSINDLNSIDDAIQATVQSLMQEWRQSIEDMSASPWADIAENVRAAGGHIRLRLARAPGHVAEADGTIVRRDWELTAYVKGSDGRQLRDAMEIGPETAGGEIATVGGYFEPFACAPNPKTPMKAWGVMIHITSVQVMDGTGDHTPAQRLSLASMAVTEIVRDPRVFASALLQMSDPRTHDMGALNIQVGYGMDVRRTEETSADGTPKYPRIDLTGMNNSDVAFSDAVTFILEAVDTDNVIASYDFAMTGPGARGTSLLSNMANDASAEASLLVQIDRLLPQGALAEAMTHAGVSDLTVMQYDGNAPMMSAVPGGSISLDGEKLSMQVADQAAVLTLETRRGLANLTQTMLGLGNITDEPSRSFTTVTTLSEMTGVAPVLTTTIVGVVLDSTMVQLVGQATRDALGITTPCELVFTTARGRAGFSHSYGAAKGLRLSQPGLAGGRSQNSLGGLGGGVRRRSSLG